MSQVRVLSGELVSVLLICSTDQFTENAERFASRRFCISAFHATLCVRSSRLPRLSVSRETDRGPQGTLKVPSEPRNLVPKLSESLVNRGLKVNNPVPFGPRKDPQLAAEFCSAEHHNIWDFSARVLARCRACCSPRSKRFEESSLPPSYRRGLELL